MNVIESIEIKNFKSLKDIKLNLSQVNLIIGPNGSGKSNLLSYFKFINFISLSNVANYFEKEGGAEMIFHFSAISNSEPIYSKIIFFDKIKWRNIYEFNIDISNDNKAFFRSERIASWDPKKYDEYKLSEINQNSVDSVFSFNELKEEFSKINYSFTSILPKIKSIRYYHFHDVRSNAPLKSTNYIKDISPFLTHNGSNLAYVLYRIKQNDRIAYNQILLNIQSVAPYISDFILEIESNNLKDEEMINLRWINKHFPEDILSIRSLSDGTLRFIALIVALLDPKDINRTIIIDEPELGLHPFAIEILSNCIKLSSKNNQLILSTQSKDLISNFGIDELIVAEYAKGVSSFKRVNEMEEKYIKMISNSLSNGETMSDIWSSNLIGGNIKW